MSILHQCGNILHRISGSSTRTKEAKFSAKGEKALNKAAIRIQTFKAANPLNFYKRSQLANAFLWAL